MTKNGNDGCMALQMGVHLDWDLESNVLFLREVYGEWLARFPLFNYWELGLRQKFRGQCPLTIFSTETLLRN